MKINPILVVDGYKVHHHKMYPQGTSLVFSNFTTRSVKYMPEGAKDVVVFGTQYCFKFIKDLFDENFFNVEKSVVIGEAKKKFDSYTGTDYDMSHFEQLHDLGYLPIEVRALREGTVLKDVNIPMMVYWNTLPEFYWVTNFLETIISTTLWKPVHSASIAYGFKKILKDYCIKTNPDAIGFVDFQGHDFSMRGMQSVESALSSGMGHSTSFKGSDTLAVLEGNSYYYGTTDSVFSVPACFPDGAEILTDKGFLDFSDLSYSDKVAQYNLDGTIEFVEIDKIHEYDFNGNLINIKTGSENQINFTVTDNHRIPYINDGGNFLIKEAKDLPNRVKFLVSGNTATKGDRLSDYERLLIAFQADGSYSSRDASYNGFKTGTIPMRFATLKKQRKIDRLEEILAKLEFTYTKSEYERGSSFRIAVPVNMEMSKIFDWVDLTSVSKEWCEDFIEELQYWDGTKRREDGISYSSIEKFNIDVIQAICAISGIKSHYTLYNDSRINRKPLHTLLMYKNVDKFKSKSEINRELVQYTGKVRCVTVPSGMIVVRQNDRVMISGNSEHAVMTSYGKENEEDAFNRIIDLYPNGVVSIVSDSYDFWNIHTETIYKLKDKITTRNGKTVFRGDSGDPVDIICGLEINRYEDLESAMDDFEIEIENNTVHGEPELTISDKKIVIVDDKYYKLTSEIDWNRYDKQYYFIEDVKVSATEIEHTPAMKGQIELLWDCFGGTINEQGYKVLDEHVGAIYGDGITLERAREICRRLEAKGFASTNIVFGQGSYLYSMCSRDSQGVAVKATACVVNGEFREIFKDPITDSGKKSAKGLLSVYKKTETDYYLRSQCTWEDIENCEFVKIFKDGEQFNLTTLNEIRENLLK